MEHEQRIAYKVFNEEGDLVGLGVSREAAWADALKPLTPEEWPTDLNWTCVQTEQTLYR